MPKMAFGCQVTLKINLQLTRWGHQSEDTLGSSHSTSLKYLYGEWRPKTHNNMKESVPTKG